jgi:hypothetical protein
MITVRSQSDLEEAFESWQAQKLSHMKVFLVAAGGSRDSSLTSSNAAFLQGICLSLVSRVRFHRCGISLLTASQDCAPLGARRAPLLPSGSDEVILPE